MNVISVIGERAREFGGRSDRMVLSDHSAGGHMVACAAGLDWPARGAHDVAIRAAVPVSGIFDLAPLRRTSINDDLELDAETAERLIPIDIDQNP